MRVYFVKAAQNGSTVDVATVDSAKQAMVQYLDAIDQYERAWVSDGSGSEMLIDDLARLALREDSRQ